MKQYKDLIATIKEKGTYKPAAREGMPGTQSYFGYQFRHELKEGFPLLTTKKMFWKGVVVELLWFLRGDTNIKFLDENGVTKMWHQDAYNYYVKIASGNTGSEANNIYKKNEDGTFGMYTFEEFCNVIKNTTKENLMNMRYYSYTLGDCGYQYGKVWRNWETIDYWMNGSRPMPMHTITDQIKNVIETLQKSPEGRRHVVTAWDPAHDKNLALTWCHALFQFNCRPIHWEERAKMGVERGVLTTEPYSKYKEGDERTVYRMIDDFRKTIDKDEKHKLSIYLDHFNVPKYYLDCQLYQRSADTVLGVPFNIASYALIIHLFAKMCNMLPGDFIHTFGDVHIYDNHKEAVEEQMKREPGKLPTVSVLERSEKGSLPDHFEKYLTGRIDLNEFLNSLTYHDFKLIDYNPQSKIDAELSTGLKK